MGIFHTLKRTFGSKFVHNASRFGKKAVNFAGKALDFAEQKALPVAEKIAAGVGKAAKLATPLVAGFAPELLPALYGVNKLSGMADKGFKKAERLIEAGHKGLNPMKKLVG